MPAMKTHGEACPAGGMTDRPLLQCKSARATPRPASTCRLPPTASRSSLRRPEAAVCAGAPDRFVTKFASPPKNPSHQQTLTGRCADRLDGADRDQTRGGRPHLLAEGLLAHRRVWPTGGPGWSAARHRWWSATPSEAWRQSAPGGVVDLQGEAQLYQDGHLASSTPPPGELPASSARRHGGPGADAGPIAGSGLCRQGQDGRGFMWPASRLLDPTPAPRASTGARRHRAPARQAPGQPRGSWPYARRDRGRA